MYGLSKLHKKFINEISALEGILDTLSNQPKSYERDIFINGSFLRAVIIWENFIEECFLAGMCKCKTIKGSILKPKVPCSRNKELAFKKISINRNNRQSEYVDWIDSNKVKLRVEENFHHKSRFHKIYRDLNILNQIQVIRNHIAHDSKKTEHKFKNTIVSTVGYLTMPEPNTADVLISSRRSSAKFYKRFLDYYIETANIICN